MPPTPDRGPVADLAPGPGLFRVLHPVQRPDQGPLARPPPRHDRPGLGLPDPAGHRRRDLGGPDRLRHRSAGAGDASERRRVLGLAVPVVRARMLISGVATAVIIGTTTLNYTFVGISILFALLLMRGGVLILAPVVDTLLGRSGPRRLLDRARPQLRRAGDRLRRGRRISDDPRRRAEHRGLLAGLLHPHPEHDRDRQVRRSRASTPDISTRRRLVAAIALTGVPALCAADRQTARSWPSSARGLPPSSPTRWSSPPSSSASSTAASTCSGPGSTWTARENTYCIPLNRCSSLLSGVVASFGLTWFLGWRPPSGYQLAAAVVILAALAILMVSTLRDYRPAMRGLAQRVVLFVCCGQYQPVADGPGALQRRDPPPPRPAARAAR